MIFWRYFIYLLQTNMSKRKALQQDSLPNKKIKLVPSVPTLPSDLWEHEIIPCFVISQEEFIRRGYALQPGRRRYSSPLRRHWPVCEEFKAHFLRPLHAMKQVCRSFYNLIHAIILHKDNEHLHSIICVALLVFQHGPEVLADPPVKRSPHIPTLGKPINE